MGPNRSCRIPRPLPLQTRLGTCNVEAVARGLTMAKGINFSPDESRLYIMSRTSVDSTRMKNAGAEPIGAKW